MSASTFILKSFHLQDFYSSLFLLSHTGRPRWGISEACHLRLVVVESQESRGKIKICSNIGLIGLIDWPCSRQKLLLRGIAVCHNINIIVTAGMLLDHEWGKATGAARARFYPQRGNRHDSPYEAPNQEASDSISERAAILCRVENDTNCNCEKVRRTSHFRKQFLHTFIFNVLICYTLLIQSAEEKNRTGGGGWGPRDKIRFDSFFLAKCRFQYNDGLCAKRTEQK